MAFAAALLLSLAFFGGASNVDGTVNGTERVIGELQDESKSAQKRFADPSNIDTELDRIGHQAEASFDANLYTGRQQAFSGFAQRAAKKANESLTNATGSEDALDEAEMALQKMDKVGDELDALENQFHDKLRDALAAKLGPELQAAQQFKRNASRLQIQAHSMMDPLYSWGDAAEDKADSLNDQTNDALSSTDEVVRKYRRHIVYHALAVQKSIESKLFVGQDRTTTWRQVHRIVRAASGHVYVQQYLADVGFFGLPSSGALMTAVLVTAAVAAALGASIVGYIVKSRNSGSSQYEQLLA